MHIVLIIQCWNNATWHLYKARDKKMKVLEFVVGKKIPLDRDGKPVFVRVRNCCANR